MSEKIDFRDALLDRDLALLMEASPDPVDVRDRVLRIIAAGGARPAVLSGRAIAAAAGLVFAVVGVAALARPTLAQAALAGSWIRALYQAGSTVLGAASRASARVVEAAWVSNADVLEAVSSATSSFGLAPGLLAAGILVATLVVVVGRDLLTAPVARLRS